MHKLYIFWKTFKRNVEKIQENDTTLKNCLTWEIIFSKYFKFLVKEVNEVGNEQNMQLDHN
jgi:hypothetical protein